MASAQAETATTRRLAWLRGREHLYYFGLTAPALALCVFFFVVPLGVVLARSFQGGPRGLLVENEIATESTAGTIRVAHVPLAPVPSGQAGASDVKAKGVRLIAVQAIEAVTGKVTLAQVVPADQFVMVSYNDVSREIVFRRFGPEGTEFEVKKPPIVDRDGNGRVSPADIRVWLERSLDVTILNADSGRLMLHAPLMDGEQILLTYRYARPTTIAHYARIMGSDFYRTLFARTFAIAFFTTIACLVIGYPVAYFLATTSTRWRTILIPLVIIPFWTSLLVRTFAWQVILGKTGLLNWALLGSGVERAPLSMLFNRFGVYVGMVQILLPYAILPVFSVMRTIPAHLMDSAASLGANRLRAFLRVYLPLTLHGVGAGAVLIFILALGFFVTPALLGGAPDRMVSNMIESSLNEEGNWEGAAALALLLLVPTVALYLLYTRATGLERLYGGAGGPPGLVSAPEVVEDDRTAERRLTAIGNAIRGFTRYPLEAIAGRLSAVPFALKFLGLGVATTIAAVTLALLVYEVPRPLLVLGTILAVLISLGAGLFATIRHRPVSRAVLGVFVTAVFTYLLLPNVVVIPISFTRHPVFLSFPGSGFTLENFASYFGVRGAGHFKAGGWIGPTLVSLEVAILVVIISVPIGSIAAYGLSRGRFLGKSLVRSLLVAPLIVPTIIMAVALLLFMSKHAPFMLGSAFMVGPIPVPLGLVAAHSILAVPFVVTILSANFHSLDRALEHAAQSLGAGRLTLLYRVVLPLMAPGIAASAFFAFLTSFDEIVIAMFLSTPAVATLPKRMWDAVRFEVDPTIAAISTLLVLLTVMALGVAAASQRALARRQLP